MTILLRQKPLPQVVRQIVQRDNGAWFDPEDMSTMYQDASGTTPVTAVEQPVGKMLDKSGNGYHATQSITASRPTLSARYNLFTGTDTFSGWTFGSTSYAAGLLTATQTTTDCYARFTTSQVANTKYTVSVKAKQNTARWLRIRDIAVSPVNGEVWFDLLSGAVGTARGTATGAIMPLADGFFLCAMTVTTSNTLSSNLVDISLADSDASRAITFGKSVYINSPQFNVGELLSQYQRVTNSTDYDTDERYFPKYLQFSPLVAIDDYLNLPYMSLYNGGAASIICARDCVSQATDTYIISERSTTSASPKYLPSRQLANSGNMDAYIVNDAAAVVLDTVGSPFSGVANAVIRSIVDSGNNLKLFKNGILAANDNYTRSGTLTLNNTTIGASVSTTTSNYASMKLYGLIITKSALTDAQRIACERYLGRKSGVQL